MDTRWAISRAICGATLLAVACFALGAVARAQVSCEEGNGALAADEPKEISVDEIVKKFTEREAALKKASDAYTFTVDMVVQTLGGGGVTGELKRTTDIGFDERGKRKVTVTYSTVSTLRGLQVTPEDYADAETASLGLVRPDNVQEYFVKYVGRQPVDQLKTFVFDIAPKSVGKDGAYFQGRVWVDDSEFAIVKTCGKTLRADDLPKKAPRGMEFVAPTFVTYREQVGTNWFPTFSRAEEVMEFPRGLVKMRETVKLTQYKKPGASAAQPN
jgi:hypothetical protein